MAHAERVAVIQQMLTIRIILAWYNGIYSYNTVKYCICDSVLNRFFSCE